MAYTILNTDGTTLLLLADGTVDQSATSLDLVGRNVNAYGQYINNNFVKLLGNFANTQGSPPRTPLQGQLWYDTTAKRMKVYDNGFKAVGGAIVAAGEPSTLSSGDLWYDTTNGQLKIYSSNSIYTIGPAFPKDSDSGLMLPNDSAKFYDNTSVPRDVIILKNFGQFIGVVSDEAFTLSTSSSLTYFNTSSQVSIVSGVTIKGDISVSGQMTAKYLSTHVNIDALPEQAGSPRTDVTKYSEFNWQNLQIQTFLEGLYPVAADPEFDELGVPLGTEVRVSCTYGNPAFGLQARRFYVVDQPGTGVSWQPKNVYTATLYNGVGVPVVYSCNLITGTDLRTDT